VDQRRTYTIEVRGRLPGGVAAQLGDLEAHVDDESTRLTGPIADSAALYGLLARLESLGVALVAVRPDPQEPNEEDRA
jgi:hypothetical protein